jgi:hypothetical protein
MAKLAAVDNTTLPPKKDRTPQGWQKYWQKELAAADKRLRIFTKQGNAVVDRFRNVGGNGDLYADTLSANSTLASLNLFWSNITTLQSMLYGATPQIDVSREHHDPDDDIARVACLLYQRILQADVEASGEDFPTALKAALQDRLLPGLGFCRVSYELETSETTPEGATEPQQQVDYECAKVSYVHWQDVTWGWARTWSEIPWLGFRTWLTKDEATKRFGEKQASQLTYKNQLPQGDEEQTSIIETDQQSNVQKAEIYEFWLKADKTVYHYSEGVDIILDATRDPLELKGFWPTPRPMAANLTTSLFVPKADFCMAQDLYNEIDLLQARISNITRAVKVVGVYDQKSGDSVGRMLQEGTENSLIPVENWAMFAEGGGLKGSIDWFPVEDVVNTLNTLIGIRDQTIGLLHEVTGMSDIMRGANTDQYTSDGTNQLKAKFGSIRVQAIQDEFARFASDLEALKAEVISKHYRPESILRQSSANYLPEPDRPKVMDAVALMQSPDVKWRVNIRPESIAMIDYAQLKSERTEYLTAMATFIQSANSMVSAVPEALPLMLEFMKFGMVGFKGSNYMEGILDQAIDMAKKAPPKKEDDGKAEQQQAQIQAEMQKIQAKSQADLQLIQAKSQTELQKLQIDGQNNLREIQAKAQADNQKILTDLRADLQVIAAKLAADMRVEEAQSTFAIAEEQTAHQNMMTQAAFDHTAAMGQIEEQNEKMEQSDDE